MARTDTRKRIRIFLSSPGDVAEERRLAAQLIDGRLRKDPGIAGSCILELVRWDDPDAPTPMDALRPPQDSVNWIKCKPSECDIVIVMLWSRLGSPFELDGGQWASGTEWEYEDARNAMPPPRVLVYRRSEEPPIASRNKELRNKQLAQLDAAEAFLRRIGSYTDYARPEGLIDRLESDLRALLAKATPARSHLPFTSSLLDRFGVASLAPAAFRAGAEAMIASYLGTPEHPVAFGGRSAMLQRLDAWLADPGSRRLLLWAPIGRGKSALVVRWLDAMGERCHPVFVPISIRFSTNRPELIYHALAARLAALLRAELPAASRNPVAHYRGFAIDFLRRTAEHDRPLLLVVDGLDEAAGWRLDEALLPTDVPPGLRILVSARLQLGDIGAGGWMHRLGWDRPSHRTAALEVAPLDRSGIADILERQAKQGTALPADIDLAPQLDRLSGGDPLLVGLYIEELNRWRQKGRQVHAAALAALEPGFAPLFRRWLEDQERLWQDTGLAVDRDRLDLLLSLLACALGPLRHPDLAALCRELRGAGFTLPRDTLKPLARWLIGDGDQLGYVLGHPKFGDFLRRDYFGDPAILEAAGKAFLSWSRGVVARLDTGTLPPHACPSYILLYLRQHLEAANAPLQDFLDLSGNGWRLAREHLEGGPSGFGADVAEVLAWARRRRTPVPAVPGGGLAVELRCSLVLASLNSLGANTPAELLVAAAKKGVLSREQALYLSHLAGAAPFCAVVPGLAGSLTPNDRTRILAEALAAARAIGSESARATALAGLAAHLSETQLAEALAAARAIGSESARATALAGLVAHLSETERAQTLAEALAAACGTGGEFYRAEALAGRPSI